MIRLSGTSLQQNHMSNINKDCFSQMHLVLLCQHFIEKIQENYTDVNV